MKKFKSSRKNSVATGIASKVCVWILSISIPAYAGGLGILAGDHLKESSDMGLPLVAIGFIYNEGYFVQKITEDGWQETSNFAVDRKSVV